MKLSERGDKKINDCLRMRERNRESLTVQTHVVEGEDGRPAGGSCAVQGHMQDAMRGLNIVLLDGEEVTTKPQCDSDVSGKRLHVFFKSLWIFISCAH